MKLEDGEKGRELKDSPQSIYRKFAQSHNIPKKFLKEPSR